MAYDRKEYMRKYYAKRKAELQAKKKARYREDKEYRNRIKKAALARRAALRSPNPELSYTIKRADGKTLFSIQRVSEFTGRSKAMLRAWESRGIIPKTIYTDSRGWRLYTESQVKAIGLAIKNWESGLWKKNHIQDYLFEMWTEDEGVENV